MDVWANSIAFDAQINALARRIANNEGLKGKEREKRELELRKNPSTKMIDDAKDYAKYSTFMDDPGKFTNWIIQGRVIAPPLRFVIPFVNTLANLTKRGWEHIPGLGLIQVKGYYSGGNKGYKNSASDIWAKMFVGTIITGILAHKYDDDIFTGSVPKNKSEREAFYRQDKRPWSIKFGDQWVSYRRVEPWNMVLSTVAITLEQLKKFKENEIDEASELLIATVDQIFENFMDSNMLSGLSTLLNRHGKQRNFFKRFAGTFVPYSSFWRSINRSIEVHMEGDAKVREVKELSDAFLQNLPFGTLALKPKMDIWGNEITLEGGVLRQWLPVKWQTETKDPLEDELERIGLYPSIPEDKITLTFKEKTNLRKYFEDKKVDRKIKAIIDPKVSRRVDIPEDLYEEYRLTLGNILQNSLSNSINPKLDPEIAAMRFKRIIDPKRYQQLQIVKRKTIQRLKDEYKE